MKLMYTVGGTTYEIEKVKVTRFVTENLYDGEAFNRSGRKHTIEGTGIIASTGDAFGTVIATDIRAGLNTPRGLLKIKFDDGSEQTLASASDSGDSYADARNGPLAAVNVTDIIGGASNSIVVVGFSYTFFNCGNKAVQRFELSVTQSIDEAGFITMTRSGTLSISRARADSGAPAAAPGAIFAGPAGFADAGSSPDLYRRLVAGTPPQGFRRVRQEFTLDASLHNLVFNVEDRMVFRDLKFPVMMGDASFDYERSLENPLGAKTFRASFEGKVDESPNALLQIAVEAAQARIDFTNDIIQSFTIREPNIYSRNRIELEVTALGQGSTTKLDMALITKMFAAMHTSGSTRYSDSYPARGVFFDSNRFLQWDPCNAPALVNQIVAPNPEDSETSTDVLVLNENVEADITESGVTKALETDAGMPQTAADIKSYDAAQTYEIVDSGMTYIETVGGSYQWPMQLKMPTVLVTQTIQMVTSNGQQPIPWPVIDDAFVVRNQNISVNSAPPDASGKPTFAVTASRTVQVQVSSSSNTMRMTASDGSGPLRVVYSPESIAQARNPYSSGNTVSAQQVDASGETKRMDFVP